LAALTLIPLLIVALGCELHATKKVAITKVQQLMSVLFLNLNFEGD
jgi:hypothetical protein